MSASNLIRGRVPGQTFMSEVVELQRAIPRRSGVARLVGVNPLPRANRPLYLAALGELLVGEALDAIGPEWDVLHVLPVGGSTPYIDHLVIGPPGVFALTTKNFAGDDIVVDGELLTVDGRPLDIIPAARAQAERASDLLSAAAATEITVQPLIVMVDPKKLAVRAQPDALCVVSSKQLLRWMIRLPRHLDGAEVARVSDISDRESTWHSLAAPVEDPQDLHREFVAIREEVANASFARVTWIAVGSVAVAAALWALVALIAQHLIA